MKKIFILLLILPLFAFSEEETPFPSGRTPPDTDEPTARYGLYNPGQPESQSTGLGTGPEACAYCKAEHAPVMSSTQTNVTPDRIPVDDPNAKKAKKVKTGE